MLKKEIGTMEMLFYLSFEEYTGLKVNSMLKALKLNL